MAFFNKRMILLFTNLFLLAGIGTTIANYSTSVVEGEAVTSSSYILNFESNQWPVSSSNPKTSYDVATVGSDSGDTVVLNGVNVNIFSGLIGNLSDDKKDESYSARMRILTYTSSSNFVPGYLTILNDFSNANRITFKYANYGLLTEGRLKLELSDNSGTTWTEVWSQSSSVSTLTTVDYTIDYSVFNSNPSTSKRFRFVASASSPTSQNNTRINLDSIEIFIDNDLSSAYSYSTNFLTATADKANCTSDSGWATQQSNYNSLSTDAKNEFKTNSTIETIIDARARYNYLISFNNTLNDFVFGV